MKKIIILLISIFLLFSCWSEESIELSSNEKLIYSYYDNIENWDFQKAYDLKFEPRYTLEKFKNIYSFNNNFEMNVINFKNIWENEYIFNINIKEDNVWTESYETVIEIINWKKLKTVSAKKLDNIAVVLIEKSEEKKKENLLTSMLDFSSDNIDEKDITYASYMRKETYWGNTEINYLWKKIICNNGIIKVSFWTFLCESEKNNFILLSNWKKFKFTDNDILFDIYKNQYVYINKLDNWLYLNNKKIDIIDEEINRKYYTLKISKWKVYYTKWNSLYRDWEKIWDSLYKNKSWYVDINKYSLFDWDNYSYLDEDYNIVLNWKIINKLDKKYRLYRGIYFEQLSWDKLLYTLEHKLFINTDEIKDTKKVVEYWYTVGNNRNRFIDWENTAFVKFIDKSLYLYLNWEIIDTLIPNNTDVYNMILINDLKWDKIIYSILSKNRVITKSVWLNNFSYNIPIEDISYKKEKKVIDNYLMSLKIIDWNPIYIYDNNLYIWDIIKDPWVNNLILWEIKKK